MTTIRIMLGLGLPVFAVLWKGCLLFFRWAERG
jgi:hypothetical protein